MFEARKDAIVQTLIEISTSLPNGSLSEPVNDYLMKISTKLLIIVTLTVAEISLTLWSVFEISKGATFHQLNSRHLKYSAIFSEQVDKLSSGYPVDADMLRHTIKQIEQQPTECLNQVNFLNKIVMRQIGTLHALDICQKDIDDSKKAMRLIDDYDNGLINDDLLVSELREFVHIFNENSSLFEEPITETVSFILRAMIPMVIFISLFNIIFIGYMSRSISRSIRVLIRLISKQDNELDKVIDQHVTGELRELLDVTKDRLTHEIMMREVNEKLEEIVKVRTESLEKANNELEQFAYRTSHDLKAPLTSTKGLARFIIEDIKAGQLDNAIEDTEKIIQQMIKLEGLVLSILSLTKATSEEFDSVPIDIGRVIENSREFHKMTLANKDINFFVKVSFDSPMSSELVRVQQIIDNLVSNAIKYSDEEKEEKLIKVYAYESEQAHSIEIEDNGLGIPESRQDEMFQMFKRFHPNVSIGSGLGLSIVKKHMDSLRATIDVFSSKNGTRFTLIFPKEKSNG